MLSLFQNKKIHAIGLDVSNVSIKVMDLTKKDGRLFPSAYHNQSLPGNLIANHMIVSEDKLAEQIKRTVSMAGRINTHFAVVSIPEGKSFVRIIKIPKMNPSEIDGALPWELEQDIPVPIDQVYMDWQILSEESDKMNLLVLASPKDYIDALIETLKMANIKPVALELESQATARALIGKQDLSEPVMILDISAVQTTFIIVENGNLTYTSSIPIAGNAFTESIARNFAIPASEAEKLKREAGLVGESKKGNIRQAILPILDNIIDEIRNIAHFYEEHTPHHAKISKIYISGGSAKLSGLVDYVSVRMNLGSGKVFGRVALGNPWTNIVGSAKDRLPMNSSEALDYSTAAGLALRGVEL